MRFNEAFAAMKQGAKAKLPSWGGYWCWDSAKKTIIMHTKDGEELDISRFNTEKRNRIRSFCGDWKQSNSRGRKQYI